MGIVYNYVLVEILVDFLNTFAMVYNLDKAYIGLSILAFGNVLPDA